MIKCQGKEGCMYIPTINLYVDWSYNNTHIEYTINVCKKCYIKHLHLEICRPEHMGVFVKERMLS